MSDFESFYHYFLMTAPRLFAIAVLFTPINVKAIGSGLIRNGVLFTLAAFLTPLSMFEPYPENLTMTAYLLIIIKEIVVGAFIGLINVIPFWVLEISGSLLDNMRGNNMANLTNPATKSETSMLSAMFQVVGVSFFYSTNCIFLFLTELINSYKFWPLLSFHPKTSMDFFGLLESQFALMFQLSILYIAPAALIMFVTDIALGLISRVVPALNVFILSYPIKSYLGAALLSLYFSLIMFKFIDHISSILVLG